MIKFNLIILVFVTLMSNLSGQSIPNWQLSASWGIEKHDKRLFDYSEKESLLAIQPENWGTYHFNANLKRKIWSDRSLSGFLSLGLGYENATFLRPFDHSHFNSDSFRILRHQNSYKKLQIPLSLSIQYEISNTLFLSSELASNFLMFRRIDQTNINIEEFPYDEGTLEMDELHFKIGINYRVKRFFIGVNSRVFNYQKIDRIIFNYLIKDPRTEQKWEWHNPLRFDVGIGYMW